MTASYQTQVAAQQVLVGDRILGYVERRKTAMLDKPSLVQNVDWLPEDHLFEWLTPFGCLRGRPGTLLLVERPARGTIHMKTRELVAQQQMSWDDRCWFIHDVTYQGEALSADAAEALAQRMKDLAFAPGQRWFPRSTMGQGFSIVHVYVIDHGNGSAQIITEEYHGIGD